MICGTPPDPLAPLDPCASRAPPRDRAVTSAVSSSSVREPDDPPAVLRSSAASALTSIGEDELDASELELSVAPELAAALALELAAAVCADLTRTMNSMSSSSVVHKRGALRRGQRRERQRQAVAESADERAAVDAQQLLGERAVGVNIRAHVRLSLHACEEMLSSEVLGGDRLEARAQASLELRPRAGRGSGG